MTHRSIGQEQLGFAATMQSRSSLDDLAAVIDWGPIAELVGAVHSSSKGEPA
jgi:hypothetical protein